MSRAHLQTQIWADQALAILRDSGGPMTARDIGLDEQLSSLTQWN